MASSRGGPAPPEKATSSTSRPSSKGIDSSTCRARDWMSDD
jgi:hypothetical protein